MHMLLYPYLGASFSMGPGANCHFCGCHIPGHCAEESLAENIPNGRLGLDVQEEEGGGVSQEEGGGGGVSLVSVVAFLDFIVNFEYQV